MDRYTLIWVKDERSPVRNIQIPKLLVRRAAWFAALVALLASGVTWDYWRMRMQNSELHALRLETTEQREQIDIFQETLRKVNADLDAVRELERKVRIIANLPGAAAVGGAQVTELAPEPTHPGAELPVGVPIDMPPAEGGGRGGDEEPFGLIDSSELIEPSPADGLTTEGARVVATLEVHARSLGDGAVVRASSLDDLVAKLEVKSSKLASMPSVWPTRGWLTSRFGPRVSPFTGRRHHHSGIDIAARHGTPIKSPARGRVAFVGRKGPLGKAVVLDHGYGVRTFYGHTSEIHVKAGDVVERGELIAAVGSTGRSTGPHLHYSVEVGGKSRNPLDYIFD